jgi:hypothetical protein
MPAAKASLSLLGVRFLVANTGTLGDQWGLIYKPFLAGISAGMEIRPIAEMP